MVRTAKRQRRRAHPGVIIEQRESTWPLEKLRALLPSKPSYRAVWHWCINGRKHPYSRRVVRMEAIEETDCLTSSIEAYWRFIQRLNEG